MTILILCLAIVLQNIIFISFMFFYNGWVFNNKPLTTREDRETFLTSPWIMAPRSVKKRILKEYTQKMMHITIEEANFKT